MIAIGLLVSGAVGKRLARHFGVNFYDVLLIFAYALIFGMSGAKITFLLLNFREIPWERLNFSNFWRLLERSGFVFYGGILPGFGGLLLARKIHKIDLCSVLQICVPLLPLAHGFGRIGCFLAGCCHGVAYSGPLAVTYSTAIGAPHGIPLFPVQLLEALVLFALFGVLLRFLLRGMRVGGLCICYLSIYATCRFLLEFLRGDVSRGVLRGLSTSQWCSLAILLSIPLGFFVAITTKRRKSKIPD